MNVLQEIWGQKQILHRRDLNCSDLELIIFTTSVTLEAWEAVDSECAMWISFFKCNDWTPDLKFPLQSPIADDVINVLHKIWDIFMGLYDTEIQNVKARHKTLSSVIYDLLSTKRTKPQNTRLYPILAALVVACQASHLANIDGLLGCIVGIPRLWENKCRHLTRTHSKIACVRPALWKTQAHLRGHTIGAVREMDAQCKNRKPQKGLSKGWSCCY